MASASKRTLRLEVDLLADERGGVIVNYQELAEKALADSSSRAETRTGSPLPPHPKSMREDQFLPSFRPKKAFCNISDFRALADCYKQDSFIDDSEMFEESIPDSLKYVGYRIRSYASDHSDTESESPSQTVSGYSSLSESNSDASVMELVEPQPPKASVAKAKEKQKKNSPQKEWSQFLKRLGQNESMEICLDRKTPVGRPRPSAAASPSSPFLPLPAKQRHPSPPISVPPKGYPSLSSSSSYSLFSHFSSPSSFSLLFSTRDIIVSVFPSPMSSTNIPAAGFWVSLHSSHAKAWR